MKKIYLLSIAFLAFFCSHAQLTGTKNIPGDYATLAAAITDLNTQGVGAGGVILNVVASNPQTAPAGGYAITATGIAANPITIRGNNNTVTTSAALVAGSLNDAVFKLIGSDYVTLTGFTMAEDAGNSTIAAATNNMTEWGVALLYASVTDGAQNNTITGNTISLNRTYTNSFGIYSNVRHSATVIATAADITAFSGSNSNNKVYSNNISNVNMGIAFIGSAVAANMDTGNDIGGSSAATGNNINNWGGAAAASGFISNIATSYGIFTNHEISVNVSFNTLVSNNTINFSGTLLGIYVDYLTTMPAGTFTDNINNNTVTLTNAYANATASQVHVIRVSTTAAGTNATATANINNNNILNCALTGTANSITLFGVLNTTTFGVVNENGNTVQGTMHSGTTGGIVGVTSQGAVITTLNLNNNLLGTATANFITLTSANSGAINAVTTSAVITANVSISNNDVRGIVYSATGSGSPLLISNTYAGSATANVNNNTFTNLSLNTTGGTTFIQHAGNMTATGVENCNNNTVVTGFTKTAAGGTITFFASNASSVTGSAMTNTGNNFSNINVTGATTIAGWSNTEGASATSGPTKAVTGNTFSNITGGSNAVTLLNLNFGQATACTGNIINNITGNGAITGLNIGTSNNSGTHNYSSNTFTNLVSSGTGGSVTGITGGSSSIPTANFATNTINNFSSTGVSSTVAGIIINAGTTVNINGNNISNLTGSGTTSPLVRGIVTSSGTTINIFKNKISGLSETGAISTTNAAVNGLLLSGGTTTNVFNNLIGDLKAPAANLTDAIRGINITSTTGTTSFNVFYNTVHLSASSTGTNFGTTALFHTFVTTATSATLTLRNNILYNNSSPNGTGLTVGLRRSAATNLNNYAAASANNLFYAGSPTAANVLFYDGTTGYQTIATLQAGLTPREAASVTELSTPFLSTTGIGATFLHLNPAIGTVAESGAATIATYTDDYDGDVRNATTPDIGADEFAGIAPVACSGTPVAGTITGTATSICQGFNSTLSLNGFTTGATGISIQWKSSTTAGGPYTPIAGANGTTYNTGAIPPGITYYVATVTCANGGGNATTAEFSVTVNPTPTIAVTPATPSICTGGTGTSLTATGASTYTWSPATGLSATTGATVTANPTATTTYTVTGTSTFGCVGTTTVVVTVNTSPTVTAVGASSTLVCAGDAVNLTASAVSNITGTLINEGFEGGVIPAGWASVNSGTGNLWGVVTPTSGAPRTGTKCAEYSWNTTQAADAYLITSGLSLTAGVTYNIGSWYRSSGTTFPEKLKITVGTAQTAAAQTTILQDVGTVNSTTYAPQNTTFTPATSGTYYFAWNCYSALNQFYLEVDDILITGPSAAPTYSWTSTPAGFTSNAQNPTGVIVNANTVYTVTATNGAGGCTASGSVTVNINNPISYTVTGGGAYCQSGTGVTVGLANSETGATYQLVLNGVTNIGAPVAGTTGSALNFGLQTTAGTYTVVGTRGTCTTTMTGSVTVSINPLPVINSTTVQPTTCVSADGAITLTITPAGTYSFAWTGPAGTNPTSQNQTGVTVGTYNVTVTNTTTLCSSSATITLNGPGGCSVCPTVGSLTGTPGTPVCNNTAVTLTASGLVSMGVTYGITFKYFAAATATPYAGGTTIATVANGALTGGGTQAATSNTFATAGTYFVYAVLSPTPADPSCRPSATTTIVVNTAPSGTISYATSPVCSSTATAAVTQTGTAGGTYTAPAGLTINATTGAVTPTSSTPGTYTVTYTVAAAGGCAAFTTTASITVTAAPSATISYAGSPYCSNSGTASVTQTGTAGGTYTAPAGLTINASTGAVTLASSTAGTYTVTYTVAAAGGCAAFTTTASITVTAAPSATISYGAAYFCTTGATTAAVTQTGSAGGTYSSTAGLSINATTGLITVNTSTPGVYTVTYTVAAAGGCAVYTTTTSVTIANCVVTVTATAGTLGPVNYPTVKTAFDAVNAGTHQGAVAVNITANTTETAPAVLNRSGAGAAVYTSLVVRPTADNITVTGNIASAAVIKLNAASNVTIDGDNAGTAGTNRNLSIINTSVTAPNILWIGGNLAGPATNDAVRNCILINGANTASGVVVSDNTTIATAGYFSNISIQNNSIQRSFIANYNIAVPAAGNGSGLNISNNDFNTAGANGVRLVAIYAQGIDGATIANNNISFANTADAANVSGIWLATSTINSTVSGNQITNITGVSGSPRGIAVSSGVAGANVNVINNTISGLTSSGTVTTTGIFVFGATSGVTVQKNRISNIKNTNAGGFGANGIQLSSTLTTANSVTVSNNYVSDVTGVGFNGTAVGDNGYGIILTSGGGYNLYYNTVVMNTNQTVATGLPAALNVTTGVTAANTLDIRNNLFVNTQTVGTQRYCVFSGAAASTYANIDYNDYYFTGPNLGNIGATLRADLAAWRTGTGKDVNSQSSQPTFVSATDFHLSTLGNCTINGGATPIAGITTDFDEDVRNVTTPDIGADEITIVASVAPTGATASNPSICGVSGVTNLSVVGGTLGTGASFKWYTGSCGGTLVGTGATLTNITVLQTTTFFVRVEGPCGNTTCASVTVNVNPVPVVVLVAANNPNVNPAAHSVLNATVSPAGNYVYTVIRNGIVVLTTTNTANVLAYTVSPDSAGVYTVRVVNVASGCTATSNPIVITSVTANPTTTIFVTPNPNNGRFSVKYYATGADINAMRSVTVYDGRGARVFDKTMKITGTYTSMDVDITHSANGTYYVKVTDANGKLLSSAVVIKL